MSERGTSPASQATGSEPASDPPHPDNAEAGAGGAERLKKPKRKKPKRKAAEAAGLMAGATEDDVEAAISRKQKKVKKKKSQVRNELDCMCIPAMGRK